MRDQIIDFLNSKGLKYTDKGKKILSQCINPKHIDKHPSSYWDLDRLFFHCSSCGYHLDLKKSDLFKVDDIQLLKLQLNKEVVVTQEIELGWLPKKLSNVIEQFRGISPATFNKVGAYISNAPKYNNRLILPHLIEDDMVNGYKIVGFEARTLSNEVPKVLRPPTPIHSYFLFQQLLGSSPTLFICEGDMSALSFIELGYSAVSNFGVGNINRKVSALLSAGIKTIYLCGDNDEAGVKFNEHCYSVLKPYSFKLYKFKYYTDEPKIDANDLLMRGNLQKTINKNSYSTPQILKWKLENL